LLDRAGEPDQAAVIRERMATQLFHLSRLVEDLLDVSRIDQGKIALRLERVQLKTVLDSAIDTSRPKIDAGGHAFTFDLPTEAVWVTADFTRLSQIVSNLLTNAAKYTPSGGTIQLRANAGPDYVEVAVSDTGVGISKDMQARVFELYTQLKGPDDRSSEGLGIGLALVRQLVDLHKGDIRVESDGPGAGSCFTIRLPRSA
jgi:signal transduction histidine kinase